jgi:hypothetical protein
MRWNVRFIKIESGEHAERIPRDKCAAAFVLLDTIRVEFVFRFSFVIVILFLWQYVRFFEALVGFPFYKERDTSL